MPDPIRISATMALEDLAEACNDVHVARNALAKAIAERDDLIKSAKASGIPYKTLGRVTRLGLNRLQAIIAKPSPSPEHEGTDQ